MLARLLSTFAQPSPAETAVDIRLDDLPKMKPLLPPAAVNDEALAGFILPLEQELEAAGYLRKTG